MPSENAESALFAGTAAKIFKVFEAFDTQSRSLSLTEVMKRTGFNKSAVQRYLFTLEALGYLEKDADSKRYALTLKTLFPASNFLSQDPLIRAAYPHVVALRQSLDARIGLSVHYQDKVTYLIPLQSIREAYQTDYPGFCVPLHNTTTGRIYLSYESEGDARETLMRIEREALTPYTKTDVDEILNEIRKIPKQGYCIADQEYRLGNINVAVPILNRDMQPEACLVAVVQSADWDVVRCIREAVPALQNAAQRILMPR